MKTYTFKIKVDTDRVVVACHMQFEQFYDSVKMSGMEKLVERYPNAYITASDYHTEVDDKFFVSLDYVFSDLASLVNSKDLKAYLLSDGYVGFVDDDDYSHDKAYELERAAQNFMLENETLEKGDEQNV